MATVDGVSIAQKTPWFAAPGAPPEPTAESAEDRLQIAVIFTSPECTTAALRTAGSLAHRLNARITVFAAQVVPFPAPLTTPPVLTEWAEQRLRDVARDCPAEVSIRCLLCRDREETLLGALAPRSLVVLGAGKRRWRSDPEAKLEKMLKRAGHEVVRAASSVPARER
jgi:hypothetical protein